jgi:catalase
MREKRLRRILTATALCFGAMASPALAAEPKSASGASQDVAGQIVAAFGALFSGPYAGSRAVHAKGVLLDGEFRPSPAAASLSRAPHFAAPVPVLVRFSNFAGVPTVPDGDPAASPRGLSVKFMLPDGGETDIVAHSYNGFPAATPDDFLEFLRAAAASDGQRMAAYVDTHPAGRLFVDAPKPTPASYANETFFGVNAFRFSNATGTSRFGRYRIEPVDGPAYLAAADAAARPTNFLADEMEARLARNPVAFRLLVQLPDASDDVVDGSVAWPDSRETIELGTIVLNRLAEAGAARQRTLLFTPLNLVGGIAPSADPLLVARNRAYRISFDHRSRDTVADAAGAANGAAKP